MFSVTYNLFYPQPPALATIPTYSWFQRLAQVAVLQKSVFLHRLRCNFGIGIGPGH
jgi:hypothetical protein